MKPLPLSFYRHDDVLGIAKELIGKWLFTEIEPGVITGGIITETEAYHGAEDKACHAYNNRRTKRTEVMFQPGGLSYVYLCYGIHHLLNVVTSKKDTPHAVLIRAMQPMIGLDIMCKRRNKKEVTSTLTSGPGSLCQALGITSKQNALPFTGSPLWIEDRKTNIPPDKILATPRIGVEYAQEHALLPWRFYVPSDVFT